MAWHSDQSKRQAVGINAEVVFQRDFICKCGGSFDAYYKEKKPGSPDFKCLKCGQLVEVKTSKKGRKYNAITISQVPFDNYDENVIIAWLDEFGTWEGVYRKNAVTVGGVREPAHKEKGTRYYVVRTSNFFPLDSVLRNKEQE